MQTQKSLHYCHQYVQPERVTFAREAKGLTKKELAEILCKTASAVTQYESGTTKITFDVFCALSDALSVRPEFLTSLAPPMPRISMDACHFRANKRLPQMERVKARAYAQHVICIYRFLENCGILFPEQQFEPYQGERLTEYAMDIYAGHMRKYFGLGNGPIQNMAHLLENSGIRIVLLPDRYAGLDAFSAWVDGIPCVMITAHVAASRMQFDYGHELAHLLLDENTPPGDLLAERRAHRFSAAFLMPRQTFTADCPSRYRKDEFLSVKGYWHVSMSAALYRARELGIMTEHSYKFAMIELSRSNERKQESGEFAPPLPTLLHQAMEMVYKEMSLTTMADALALKIPYLEQLLREQGVAENIIQTMQPKPRPQGRILYFADVRK